VQQLDNRFSTIYAHYVSTLVFVIRHPLCFEMLSISWSLLGEFCRNTLTVEGEGTARDCLSQSRLYDFAWPLMIISAHNTSAMNPSVVRHSPEPIAKGSHEPLKVLVMLPNLHQREIRVASLI